MKKLILFSLICFAVQVLPAQINFKTGIRVGFNSGTINEDALTLLNPSLSNVQNLVLSPDRAGEGFSVGLFTRLTLLKFFIQPEILYRRSSAEYRVTDGTTGEDTGTREEKFSYIDVPILVGSKFLRFFRVEAGPVATFILSSDSGLESLTNFVVDRDFNSARWGLQLGVGADVKKLAFDVNYRFNITSEDDVAIDGENFSLNSENGTFVLGVAYIF